MTLQILCKFEFTKSETFRLILMFAVPTHQWLYGNFRPTQFEPSELDSKMVKMIFGTPTWCPSWLEIGKILEMMRFVDYVNSWKLNVRRQYKTILPQDYVPIEKALTSPWMDWRAREDTNLPKGICP